MRFHVALLSIGLWGCAHLSGGGPSADIKAAADEFHKRARWRDFIGVSELVVSEKREAFEDARRIGEDDRDLTITDYEVLDVRAAPDGDSGRVVSRVQWLRLPSPTERTAQVRTELVKREGAWFVKSQDDGPFVAVLRPDDG
ncbi:MAG: hypothetical protein ACKVPX_06440 [Myxococcaceae bacterium]